MQHKISKEEKSVFHVMIAESAPRVQGFKHPHSTHFLLIPKRQKRRAAHLTEE